MPVTVIHFGAATIRAMGAMAQHCTIPVMGASNAAFPQQWQHYHQTKPSRVKTQQHKVTKHCMEVPTAMTTSLQALHGTAQQGKTINACIIHLQKSRRFALRQVRVSDFSSQHHPSLHMLMPCQILQILNLCAAVDTIQMGTHDDTNTMLPSTQLQQLSNASTSVHKRRKQTAAESVGSAFMHLLFSSCNYAPV